MSNEAGPPAVVRTTPSEIGRGTKVSERIAAALVGDIISGGLKTGDRLPNEAAMVERFQVGRGSLREALRILEVHGVISLRSGPRGGPVVVDVDARDVGRTFSLYLSLKGATLGELVETRLMIEPAVARLAAQNLNDVSRLRLEGALAREAAVVEGDSQYIAAANDFHYTVASMTGNVVLDLVATALKELYTSRIVGGGIARDTTGPSIKHEHRQIGEAILAGDVDAAERLMREHMTFYLTRIDDVEPGFKASAMTWG
ncbi:MAG: FadR/GntR family transcriptional regulator [Aeromicrobium sp.]